MDQSEKNIAVKKFIVTFSKVQKVSNFKYSSIQDVLIRKKNQVDNAFSFLIENINVAL